jgi:hypothetical protein
MGDVALAIRELCVDVVLNGVHVVAVVVVVVRLVVAVVVVEMVVVVKVRVRWCYQEVKEHLKKRLYFQQRSLVQTVPGLNPDPARYRPGPCWRRRHVYWVRSGGDGQIDEYYAYV